MKKETCKELNEKTPAGNASVNVEAINRYTISVAKLESYSKCYASLEWYQIPVKGKTPVVKDWPNRGALEWEKGWCAANIGIITGRKSGIVVLDVDPKNGGDESLTKLVAVHGDLDTVQVVTGSGGSHYYFKYPLGLEIGNSAGRLGAGLDIRGSGGYVVAPPSVHPATGKGYEWVEGRSPMEKELADIPQWLLDGILSPVSKVALAHSKLIFEGGRNDAMFKMACSLRARGLVEEAILSEVGRVNRERCTPPLGDDEIISLVESSLKYEPGIYFLHTTKKGKPKRHWENTQALLTSLDIKICFNSLIKKVEVTGLSSDTLTFDAVVTEILGLCEENDYSLSDSVVSKHIGLIAEKNKYSPVCDYLDSCECNWDGVSRIEQLFNCFVLEEGSEASRDLLLSLFRKWFITAARLAFNSGTMASQGILILKGPQGIGKTRWLNYILPDVGKSWGYTGMTLDPANKDDVLKANSFWIIELGEIRASVRKERLDHLKGFITNPTDSLRLPYGRSNETFPRTTVFYGTVNNDQFLKDGTGERRYWVIPIVDLKFDENLEIDQLWGEIAHLAEDEKISHWLSPEEIRVVNEINEGYRVISNEEEILLEKLNWGSPREKWQWMASTQICKEVGINYNYVRKVGQIMTQLSKTRGIETRYRNGSNRYFVPQRIAEESEGYYG